MDKTLGTQLHILDQGSSIGRHVHKVETHNLELVLVDKLLGVEAHALLEIVHARGGGEGVARRCRVCVRVLGLFDQDKDVAMGRAGTRCAVQVGSNGGCVADQLTRGADGQVGLQPVLE